VLLARRVSGGFIRHFFISCFSGGVAGLHHACSFIALTFELFNLACRSEAEIPTIGVGA